MPAGRTDTERHPSHQTGWIPVCGHAVAGVALSSVARPHTQHCRSIATRNVSVSITRNRDPVHRNHKAVPLLHCLQPRLAWAAKGQIDVCMFRYLPIAVSFTRTESEQSRRQIPASCSVSGQSYEQIQQRLILLAFDEASIRTAFALGSRFRDHVCRMETRSREQLNTSRSISAAVFLHCSSQNGLPRVRTASTPSAGHETGACLSRSGTRSTSAVL